MTSSIPLSVRADGIASLLDHAPADVRILSLDCFDTLLWRNVHAPRDVFAELTAPGGAPNRRGAAERSARRARASREGLSEVSIEAICERLAPGASEAAVAAELAAEARHCFAFAPVVDLIAEAHARGLTVMVVSDTYLSEVQLRALIAATAGQEVADAIDVMFCSSEHGRAKGEGLFRTVLEQIGVAPGTILHLGDNRDADFVAARELGIHGVHFEQFAHATAQQLRFEAAAARMIEPATGVTLPTLQPHRAALSIRPDADETVLIGHDVLGPLMLGFARWVRAEADALAASSGRPVKLLFLLRDGHLPHRMFAAAGLGDAATVEISRFTARRAGFGDVAAIHRYLAEEKTEQVAVLGRQLLLEDGEIARLGAHRSLRAAVVQPEWVAKIVKRSALFADRLAAHIRSRVAVARGDTLMLVDLGYQGSVQDRSHTALTERLGVDIAGRYLLLTELLSEGGDKKGLLDARHYDCRALLALASQIALLEQLCTVGHGSVVDYRADGKPVRRTVDITPAQRQVREQVQLACLSYLASEGRAKHRPAGSDCPEAERRMAAAVLARMLLLPRSEEVALLHRFDHDVNLGTSELAQLIDPDAAAEGLRQRGLGYISGANRMFLAGEVQHHGLPLSLSLMATACFGLDLRQSDFQTGGIEVPLLLMSGAGELATQATAYPTHEGYYALTVPVKANGFAIGIQIGRIAEIVQIESIAAWPAESYAEPEGRQSRIAVSPILDRLETIAPGLHRCDELGLIFAPPIRSDVEGPLVLAVVFRPVVRRAAAMALKRAA